MKKYFILLALCFFISITHSQNHLVSYYNSYSQVYGGMEDGGISRTESYYFKVKSSIRIIDVFENGKELQLKKGDTLIISIHSYIPYHNNTPMLDSALHAELQEQIQNAPKPEFKIYRSGRKIYAHADSTINWNKSVTYFYKSRKYIVPAKDGFDAGTNSYAP